MYVIGVYTEYLDHVVSLLVLRRFKRFLGAARARMDFRDPTAFFRLNESYQIKIVMIGSCHISFKNELIMSEMLRRRSLTRLELLNKFFNRFNRGLVHEVKSLQLLLFGFGIIVFTGTYFQNKPYPPAEFVRI